MKYQYGRIRLQHFGQTRKASFHSPLQTFHINDLYFIFSILEKLKLSESMYMSNLWGLSLWLVVHQYCFVLSGNSAYIELKSAGSVHRRKMKSNVRTTLNLALYEDLFRKPIFSSQVNTERKIAFSLSLMCVLLIDFVWQHKNHTDTVLMKIT